MTDTKFAVEKIASALRAGGVACSIEPKGVHVEYTGPDGDWWGIQCLPAEVYDALQNGADDPRVGAGGRTLKAVEGRVGIDWDGFPTVYVNRESGWLAVTTEGIWAGDGDGFRHIPCEPLDGGVGWLDDIDGAIDSIVASVKGAIRPRQF